MSKVEVINPNILVLEYRQEKGDPDYGSCLWARFTFNLDRYELSINSDCGSYGYKWCETPSAESFLHLMARCDKYYILDKIYGEPKVFDYEATKKAIYESYGEDEDDKAILDEIFEEIEASFGEPNSSDVFVMAFEDAESPDHEFPEYYEDIKYTYPANARKICEVFEVIREKIREILKERDKA